MITLVIFDLSNQNNMNTYIALFTQPVTIKRIKLNIDANDYSVALEIARAYASKMGYRFDDLNYKSKAKAPKQ